MGSKILELSLEGLQSPRRKPSCFRSYRPPSALSPHGHHHLSIQRLGLVPVPVSRGPAQCWLQTGHLVGVCQVLGGNRLPPPQPEPRVSETPLGYSTALEAPCGWRALYQWFTTWPRATADPFPVSHIPAMMSTHAPLFSPLLSAARTFRGRCSCPFCSLPPPPTSLFRW